MTSLSHSIRFRYLLAIVSVVCWCIVHSWAQGVSPQPPLQDPEPIKFVEQVLLSPKQQDYCNPQGQIKDTCCDFRSVEDIQKDIFPTVQSLVKTKFFRYYKLNLWRECPFWDENGLCMNRDCSVATADESSIPEEWRQQALSAIQMSPRDQFQLLPTCQYKDQDFCLIDDESDSDGVYVDLTMNPERFTGYAGESAGRVWKAIYEENCFDIVHKMTEGCETCNNILNLGPNSPKAMAKTSPVNKFNFPAVPHDKAGLNQLLEDLAETPDGDGEDAQEVCLEKRVYYRLISGLHSSISIHICDEYFNQTTGVWGPNLDCFVTRIGSHPERLQNVYFTYALVIRAVNKLGNYLEDYEFCTGDSAEDMRIKAMVSELIQGARSCPSTFDETSMFASPEAKDLKIEFRDHFRNVSRIMDCVGCEKCRLWGKIQTAGLGTALKILFSYEDNTLNPKISPPPLQRTEIVALFNTLNRLSESLEAIKKFRQMYHEYMTPPPPPPPTLTWWQWLRDNIVNLWPMYTNAVRRVSRIFDYFV